jgi:MFS family permease
MPVKIYDSLVPRDFRQRLTGPLRRFYLITLLNTVGVGFTLSFYVIYLHNVRGFSTTFATLLLSASAITGLASSPLWGTLTDRFGPVRIMVIAYFLDAAALVAWAYTRTEHQAVASALALAVFSGAGWGPASTLLSRMVPEAHRQRAFGLNFMLVNLGIGFGTLIAATIVNLHHPATFTFLYVMNAGVTLLAGAVVLTLRAYGRPNTDHHDDPIKSAEGWTTVLGDRRLLHYALGALVMMIGGYGSQEAGFSLFVVNDLKLPVHVIGIIFFFNTTTIVLSQLWVLNRIEGRSRTRVLALSGVLWFAFWVILDAALALPEILAVSSLCVAMVIFAIGETMMQPCGPAIVNQIAPEHLRGRYNAAAGLAYGASGSIAPVLVALFFSNHLGKWWPGSVGLAALAGSALMLSLRHRLSASEDGRGAVAAATTQ